MNHKYLLSTVALTMLPLAASALPTDFYAPSSRLASGNWVRVGVRETGIYEITYDQLREMGFSNPASVAIFGSGGRQMPETFTDAEGNPLIKSDLQQVSVMHKDNKLFFYGLGIEDIRFVENSAIEMGGSFQKYSLNIYTNQGYYFLTDSSAPLEMAVSTSSSTDDSRLLTQGASYIYHEKEIVQNNTGTGQLFWGEHFYLDGLSRSWDVDLHDLVGGGNGAMECKFYTLKNLNSGFTNPDTMIWLGYGVGNNIKTGSAAAHYPLQNQNNTSDYIPQEPSVAGLSIPEGTDKVFVELEDGHAVTGNFNLPALDYWVLSYPRYIPTLKDSKGNNIPQDLIAFPEMMFASTATFELSDPVGKCVWDVTDPESPRELPVSISGDKGIVVVERLSKTPVIAVFDRMATQKRISGFENGWERINNQNIHALREEGCDMAIITLPWLYDSAKKIADLHEREYGDKVVVLNAQDIYNEFSAGVPDPMAYRSVVKMFYTSPGRQIKNLLLAGPLYGDFRGMNLPIDPERGLIAFQAHELNLETQSMNANDFYGMMADYFNVFAIEKQTQHVGVGILPVYSNDELDRYTEKLEKFMKDETFAYRLTSTLNIGGIGDNHIHDQQAVDLSSYYNNILGNSALNTILAIDAYGYEQSRNKWYESFNNGRHIATYFGHGGPAQLGQNKLFFTSGHVPQFKNISLPFMIFFGCTISNSDHGIRGLGESMVFDTEHGLIGSLLATRSTWSGQNYDFSKLVLSSFYYTNPNSLGSSLLTAPLTLGEVMLKAKNAYLFANEMAYQLLADPGLIFPVALQKINVITPASVTPGQTLKISGSVSKVGSTAVDTNFNGEIVVRVLEPEFSMVAEDLASTLPNTTQLKVSYADEQMSMSVARVENGKFDLEIYIPLQMTEHNGRKLSLNFCAYNPATRTGASIAKNAEVKLGDPTVRPTPDLVSPMIDNLSYDHETNLITVSASDDVALDLSRNMLLSGFQVYIDDNYLPEGSSSQPILIDNTPRAYTREFTVGNLPSGQHAARVIVKDASGNKTESEITFTISPETGKYHLALRENGLDEYATFYVDGNMPETATIYITSPEGTEVTSLDYKRGDEVIWDGTDRDGERVAPGRYKAFMRENGNHNSKGHADIIIVPVI